MSLNLLLKKLCYLRTKGIAVRKLMEILEEEIDL